MEWTVPCLGEGGQYQEEAGTTVFQNILHSHLPIPIPRSTVPNPANGGADTASLFSLDLVNPLAVIDLICASPDSGVVPDDFNPLSSTSRGHLVAFSSHDHSPPPCKTVQSHSILVDENQSTCTLHATILLHPLWQMF